MKKNKAGCGNRINEIELKGRKIFVSETETDNKGSFNYTDQNGKVLMVIGKSLGKVGAKSQARTKHSPPSTHRNFTVYEEKILKSKIDILGKGVLAQKGDPSYEKVADLLSPLGFPYTFLGDKEYNCRPSPCIDWDGSIRGYLGFGLNGKPLDWMSGEQQNVSRGLLDGYLPAIQFVYVNDKARIGWEEIVTAKAYPAYDNLMLIFLRLKVKNLGHKSRKENISIFFTHFRQVVSGRECGKIDTPALYPAYNGSSVEPQPEWLWVSEENDYQKGTVYPFSTIHRPCLLQGGEEKSLYLVMAYPRYLKQGTFKRLIPGVNFYRALFEVKNDWDRFLEKGMQVETPEPRVNNACKATLIQGFMTVVNSDVKYAAAGEYMLPILDGLPISIVNAIECFSEWGYPEETGRYLTYFLKHYVKPDGSSTYKPGVGAYDYGLLLYAICRHYRLSVRNDAWVKQNIAPIRNICKFIVNLREISLKNNPEGSLFRGLITSTLGDDLKYMGDIFYNYSNDACCWLGLSEVGKMLEETGKSESQKALVTEGRKLIQISEAYKKDVINSMNKIIDRGSKPMFVPIYPNNKPFPSLTSGELASYSNYGFYNHLLYANMFDSGIASAVVTFREKRGGEILGTSRFRGHLDDWPIAEFGWALVNLDMTGKFLLTYYSDLAHHRVKDIFTGYEQVGIVDVGGGRPIVAGYNICSTLALPRMTKYMLVFEERDQDLIWLNRAAPGKWLEDGKKIVVKNAPTRWGKISYGIESQINKNFISAQIEFAGPSCDSLSINLRLRHPDHKKISGVRVNGKEWQEIDTNKEIIRIPCPNKRKINLEVRY